MPSRLTRRAIVGAAATGLAGCATLGGGEATPMDADNPALGEVTQEGDLELTSPAFEDGEAIPRTYGRHQADVNPPLEVAGVPDDAGSLVLVVDDPDAVEPAGQVWLHWLVWNIDPGRRSIPEDWDGGDAVQGANDFGERGYGGPAPPDAEHRYRFKLYAVDRTLDLPDSASKADAGSAMAGGVLARTQLDGTFAP